MGITTKISQQLEGNSLLRPNHTKQFARQKPPPPQGPRTNQEMSAKVREFPGSGSPTRHHWNTISRHGQALNTTCLEDRNPRAHGNSTGHHLPQGDASQKTDHVAHAPALAGQISHVPMTCSIRLYLCVLCISSSHLLIYTKKTQTFILNAKKYSTF